MNKYKTIHENKNELEQFFSKKNLVEKMKIDTVNNNILTMIIMELDRYIIQLDKYTCTSNNNSHDCYCTMNKDDNGEYVKLEDVLNLLLVNMI